MGNTKTVSRVRIQKEVTLQSIKEMLVTILSFSLFSSLTASLSKCELSIVRCCAADFPSNKLPLRCFEVNGCPGLYWHGKSVCGKELYAAAVSSINSIIDVEIKSNILTITYDLNRKPRSCPKTWSCGRYGRKNTRCPSKANCSQLNTTSDKII